MIRRILDWTLWIQLVFNIFAVPQGLDGLIVEGLNFFFFKCEKPR